VDSIQRVVTSARGQKHGDGFEGILHELIRPREIGSPSPFEYVRLLSSYADGHVFTLCTLLGAYERRLLSRASYMEVDVYFGTLRAPDTILSFSTWDRDASIQVVVVRVETNKSSSEDQFYRMILATFNFFLDNGIRVLFAPSPEGWVFVADFCLPQAKALARAACRIGGDAMSVDEMMGHIMQGCSTHKDRMIYKVVRRCVETLDKQERDQEAERIAEQLQSACASHQEGAWKQAWTEIVSKYEHVRKQAEWWCNPVVMRMIVFAAQSVVRVGIPNSTNAEEGIHFFMPVPVGLSVSICFHRH